MRAIRLQQGRISLVETPPPIPAEGEALVAVRLAGICATDLELIKGYYPFEGVLGHEFVGEVVAAAGRSDLIGARVVGEINAVCGACAACRRGDRSHCEDRTVLGISGRDGAFAEYLTLPFENLHRVPNEISDQVAVFTEPVAAALEILEQIPIGDGVRVLLVGAGRLGQVIARVLAGTGCDLTVVAKYPVQRDLLEAVGIRTADPLKTVGSGFDLVVEATGSQAGFETARRYVRPRGTIVLKSTYAGRIEVDFSAVVVDEITLIGSRCGPFDKALAVLFSGAIDPRPLIDSIHPLELGVDAIEEAGEPGKMKVLIENR
ncbi:MAG TPA: alcohol dehydrogenase catalytic domain-containing protein [Anaerolineales bacterium]|nr:alcohol dehydrogenase catalytic domain-containing protein [Anaerolineales bacterium]